MKYSCWFKYSGSIYYVKMCWSQLRKNLKLLPFFEHHSITKSEK